MTYTFDKKELEELKTKFVEAIQGFIKELNKLNETKLVRDYSNSGGYMSPFVTIKPQELQTSIVKLENNCNEIIKNL